MRYVRRKSEVLMLLRYKYISEMESDCLIGVNKHHIVRSNTESEAFCGDEINLKDTDYLDDYIDPTDKIEDVCPDCLREYNNWAASNNRDPTIRCSCDLDGDERCGKTVSAYKARELEHPNTKQNKPVCPSCYRWLRYLNDNDIETEYKNAKAWFDPMNVEPTPKNE